MRYLGGPLDRAASDRKLDRFQHAFDTAFTGGGASIGSTTNGCRSENMSVQP